MALQPIIGMVKARLPFLPTDGSYDSAIENFITEQFYYLQKYTGKTDLEVEDEANYSGLQKMLVAELVCVEFIMQKVLANVGGTGGANPVGIRRIKKVEADVVSTEFDYAKAADGTILGMTADALLMKHQKKACEYAATLGYYLPMCQELGFCPIMDTPAFLSFVPDNTCGCP